MRGDKAVDLATIKTILHRDVRPPRRTSTGMLLFGTRRGLGSRCVVMGRHALSLLLRISTLSA
jgi:hypothetical protein